GPVAGRRAALGLPAAARYLGDDPTGHCRPLCDWRSTVSHADDLVILGFLADPILTELDQRWRQLRSSLHPDRGGDPASFDVHRRAYDRLRAHLLRPKLCPECDGLGFDH